MPVSTVSVRCRSGAPLLVLALTLAACDGLADAATCGPHRTAHDWPGPLWRVAVEAPPGTRVRLLTVEDERELPLVVTAPDTVLLVGDRVEAYADPVGPPLRLVLDNETHRWSPTRGCGWSASAVGWDRADVASGTGVLDVAGRRSNPPFAWWRLGGR